SRRAARGFSRVGQRLRFCMGPAAQSGHAAPDDNAILDDDRANRRIGPRQSFVTPRMADRRLHEANIIRSRVRMRKPVATHAQASRSSPVSGTVNSSMTLWKSTALLKLR